MRIQIATALAAITIGITAQASFVTDELEGRWELKERLCTDGSEPSDAFVLGEDRVEIAFSGNTFQTQYEIGKDVHTSKGTFEIRGRYLVSQDELGRQLFYLGQDELVLFSAGFGGGGTCPVGEGIAVIFKKL